MPYWESALLLFLAFVILLGRTVPMSEWAKWRTWFVPYGKQHPDDDEPDDGDETA